MHPPNNIPWLDPVGVARDINSHFEHWVFLYSSMKTSYSGRYSIIAFDKKDELKSDHFQEFNEHISNNNHTFDNAWFGYLGYELKHDIEQYTKNGDGIFKLPHLWMTQFHTLLVFDHDNKTLTRYGKPMNFDPQDIRSPDFKFGVSELKSNMTKAEYLEHVSTIKEGINKGDLYQSNLTRKFSGKFTKKLDPFDLFRLLSYVSPAPYSAYLQLGDFQVISSSPEQFIKIDPLGLAEAQPIKGTSPRSKDPEEDRASKVALANSEKDRAENLMIVDLMRNDLSRTSEVGSVAVEKLFNVTSFATIHHMSTVVKAQKHKHFSSLDMIKACFPPGSMTGAPKIKAIEYSSSCENIERDIYSGAIGWFGGNGSADLSVVIRTIITDGVEFEFQVGGAIVYDSDPELEWKETLYKARGICRALRIDESELAAL